MTKLMEWLLAVGAILAVWLALITETIDSTLTKQYPTLVFYSPIILVLIFGVISAAIVLYRTFTFNNCEEAAAELQREILEAKEELRKLGYKPPSNVKT